MGSMPPPLPGSPFKRQPPPYLPLPPASPSSANALSRPPQSPPLTDSPHQPAMTYHYSCSHNHSYGPDSDPHPEHRPLLSSEPRIKPLPHPCVDCGRYQASQAELKLRNEFANRIRKLEIWLAGLEPDPGPTGEDMDIRSESFFHPWVRIVEKRSLAESRL